MEEETLVPPEFSETATRMAEEASLLQQRQHPQLPQEKPPPNTASDRSTTNQAPYSPVRPKTGSTTFVTEVL